MERGEQGEPAVRWERGKESANVARFFWSWLGFTRVFEHGCRSMRRQENENEHKRCVSAWDAARILSPSVACRRLDAGRKLSLSVACRHRDAGRRLSPRVACRRGNAGRRLSSRVVCRRGARHGCRMIVVVVLQNPA